MRGSSSSLAAAPAARLSRSTLAKTCAEASCTGVLSAATHSGAQISCVQRRRLPGLGEQLRHRHRRRPAGGSCASSASASGAASPSGRPSSGPSHAAGRRRGGKARAAPPPSGAARPGTCRVSGRWASCLGEHAGEAQQAGELAVGADQDVLAVVHPPVVILVHHARAPAQGVRALEHASHAPRRGRARPRRRARRSRRR